MPESQAKGTRAPMSGATRPPDSGPVTVTINPEHARAVADLLINDGPSDAGEESEFLKQGGGLHIADREALNRLRATLDQFERRLARVGWGEPTEPFTLSDDPDELRRIADRLVGGGGSRADDAANIGRGCRSLAGDVLPEARQAAAEVAAGVAIYEQLDPITEAAS